MRIAAWNLNHRAGRCQFRPEAVEAAMALNADAIIFTEYFPKHHAAEFEQRLRSGGWRHQLKSSPPPPTKEAFNYALVVS